MAQRETRSPQVPSGTNIVVKKPETGEETFGLSRSAVAPTESPSSPASALSTYPWKTVTTLDVKDAPTGIVGPTQKKVHIIEFEGSIVAIPDKLLQLILSTRARGPSAQNN